MALAELLLLRFRLRRGARFHFVHGPAIYAFLMDRLGNPPEFPAKTCLASPETGRARYEPGDFYHLGLAVLPGAPITAAQWPEIVQRPPRTEFGQSDGAPFGAGAQFVDARCAVSGRLLARAGEGLVPLDRAWLDRATEGAAGRSEITVRFDAPLLIFRTPVERKDTYFDETVFSPEVFFDRVARACTDQFAALRPEGPPPKAELVVNRLARLETRYGARTKRLLGARGTVTLSLAEPLDRAWARALLLAGLVGVGKSTALGQGRFSIEQAPLTLHWPPPPARTLAERAARPEAIDEAVTAMRAAGRTPGVDEQALEDFLLSLDARRATLARRLARGEVRASPLRGLLLQREDGRVRGLAVPTMEDRFLQRAVVHELAPAIDEVLEDGSFAYRRGLSRAHAQRSIERARADGFVRAFDADLRAFFDRVDWRVLETRLRAYFLGEALIDRVLDWVRAPVMFAGRTIARTSGLPQGAPVSPILANLYLDSLDEVVEAAGFRMVRYGDDFLVLCRGADDVARARAVVEEELERLRLSLAPEKTGSADFERGFDFLGYLFCKSVTLEKTHDAPRIARVVEPFDPALAGDGLRALVGKDATGWVASLLDGTGPSLATSNDDEEPKWRRPLVPSSPTRRPVYVVDPGLALVGTRRGLRVLDGQSLRAEVAWDSIGEIAVLGGHRISASTFQHAMHRRVPIAFYTRAGAPLGLVLPDRVRAPSPATYAHWAWAQDPAPRLPLARSLVEAKLHHARLLARHQPGDNGPVRAHLAALADQALRAATLAQLRGIEGQAAHAYFARWDEWLGPDWAFAARTGRGALDPVNVLLNLLYTQLFRLCWFAAIQEGLDPYLGVMHEGRGRYAALAADLQEPFRVLCDRLALELMHRGRLSPADFVRQEKVAPPMRLSTDALRLVLGEWERRLELPVTAVGVTTTWRRHVQAQARRLAEIVAGARSELDPFRLKW
jgi:CRISPR-associated protein Cas1